MSEEPSAPDLVNTDDIPLDEVAATNIIQPETIAEALGSPSALFTDARPLGLNSATEGGEGLILEEAVRSSAPRMPSIQPAVGGVSRFLPSARAEGNPIYRRQGVLAVIALGVLTLIALITFPRTESTLESGLAVSTDAPAPAAGVVGSNAGDGVDQVGTDGFFVRSKSERTAIDADLAKIAAPQTGKAADQETTTTDGEDQGVPAPGTTPEDGTVSLTIPPDTDVDSSVLVGPDPTEAPTTTPVVETIDMPTTQTPTTQTPTTRTPTTQTPATTRPQTTTTERRTTTTITTTTIDPDDTSTTTTIDPDDTTTTTVDPDDTSTTVTTTEPSSTTTTVDPDDTPTSVTIPDGGPTEDPDTSQGPVFCTDNPEACNGSTTTTTTVGTSQD